MYWPTLETTFAIRNYEIRTDLEEIMGDIVKRTFTIQSTKLEVS